MLVIALALPQAGAMGTDDVDLVGQVMIEHADDFVAKRSEQTTFLETKSGRFKLDGPKAQGLASGTTVRVRGKRSGSTVVLGDGSSVGFVASATGDQFAVTTASGPTATAAAATIQKRVAVLLINFVSPTPTPTPTPSPTPTPTPTPTSSSVPTLAPTANPNGTPTPTPTPSPTPTPTPTPTPSPTPSPTPPPPQPWTLSSVRGTFFTNTRSIASYYSELSNGKMAVTGDVFGYFTLSMNTPTCDYTTWGSAARQAATAAGINLSAYTNVVHAFTKQSACWWGGMGQLPGKYSWLNGNLSLYVVSHELGHNFGAHHASSLTCTKSGSRVAFSSSCTADEYGDPYDVMGYGGERHMQVWHRKQLGFLTTSDQQTVTANGRYFVSTAEIQGGSPRIVRVSRPSGKYYYLELRQPYGLFDNFTSTALAVTGVTIRIAPDTKVTQSELIDAHPATSTFNDAPLKPGETFTDPVNGISITTTSISPTGAQLRIQVGPDTVAPSTPTNLSTTVPSATSIKLSWTAATDDLEVTGYRITRNGVALATASGTSYTDGLNLAQGATYTYAVSAVDGGGNLSPPATTTRLMPDVVAPSQPGAPAAVQTDVRSVGVSWTAATDNVGVTGYAITRNGVPLVTTGATQLGVADAALIDGFGYEYAIQAFDAAGNQGPAATASVYLPDVTAPSAPGTTTSTGLTATGTTVRVGWLPATDNVAVVGYTVTRDGVQVATLNPATTTFEQTGLPSDTTYRYGVVAFDAAGNVGPEAVFSVQLKSRDLAAPTVPTNLKGTPLGSRRIQLTWGASTDDRAGTIQYRIFRGTTRIATVTTTSYVDRPAAVGWYTYKVRAVDVAGNKSAFTPTISVKARRTV